jgi:hypothetical protein
MQRGRPSVGAVLDVLGIWCGFMHLLKHWADMFCTGRGVYLKSGILA